MQRLILNSRQEFLNQIKKAKIVILYADRTLPIWDDFVCSLGKLNMQILSYDKYEVIEILPHIEIVFKLFWTKVPEVKYYFIQRLNENDKHGAVIPATSNEIIEKWLEEKIS